MEPINFNTFIKDSLKTNSKSIAYPKYSKDLQDSFELSDKNKDEKTKKAASNKKLAIIVATAGLALAGIFAAIKIGKSSKVKKEITTLYDKLFEEIKQSAEGTINFEKPKLVFKRLKGTIAGGYMPSTNEIHFDHRFLRNMCVRKDLSTVHSVNLTDDLKVANNVLYGNLLSILKRGAAKNYRLATKNEALTITGSTLVHELTHAKQFQTVLSTKNGAHDYLESLKVIGRNLSDGLLKKNNPFIFNYKPKTIFPENMVLTEDLGEGGKLLYKIKDLTDAFVKYPNSMKHPYKYFTNLAEVGARNAEARYWEKFANGEYEIPKGVSKKFIDYLKSIAEYNSLVLSNAVAKAKKS